MDTDGMGIVFYYDYNHPVVPDVGGRYYKSISVHAGAVYYG